MVMLMVTANSRNTRPTTPLMNSTGMNTATSDRVIDMMVKPISREPRKAASITRSPLSTWRTMFSSMTMASSTTNPTDSVKRQQRQIVDAVAHGIHAGESADHRDRQGQGRDDGGGDVAQEQEDHQHHQHGGQHQRELDVIDRIADRHRAVAQDRQLRRGGQLGLEHRQQRLDRCPPPGRCWRRAGAARPG